jgi:hypothetical protein
MAFLLVGLCLGIMAFRSIRFMAEFLLISSPVVAVGLSRWKRFEWARGRVWVLKGPLLATAGIFAVVGSQTLVNPLPFGWGVSTRNLPAASAEFLNRHASNARILASVEDSWYLMFAVPEATFLVDGRVPFYGTEHIRMVQHTYGSPAEMHRTLDRFGVDTVVVQHDDIAEQVALGAMRASPSWSLVVIEDRYATFLRESPERSELIGRQAYRALAPAYEPEFVLGVDVDVERLRQERSRLPNHRNTIAYRAWVDGLLGVRPLAEAGGRSGLRPPRTDNERASLATARAHLDVVAITFDAIPTVGVHRAMAAVADCDLRSAEEILDVVEADGGFRETLLLRQEISLRQGHVGEVRDFLARARAVEETAQDPWVIKLVQELEEPPRCGR